MQQDSKAIEAYINKGSVSDFYKKGFAKYSAAGVDQFAWHWSWWALFGGVFYLLYRKLYMEALIFLVVFAVIGMIPFGGLVAWIASGGVLPYFVYKRYKTVKSQVEMNFAEESEQLNALREVGGYNQWAIWLGVAVHVVMWLGMLYMLAAIGMSI